MTTGGWETQAHAGATWFMVGVIWIVQLVHYPMFEALDRARFSSSHAYHSRSISIVVVPAMLAELVLAALLGWKESFHDLKLNCAFGILIVIWATTFFIIVPLHERLRAEGFRKEEHRSLLRWNWIRTVGWSVRGLIVLAGS
jgi:hypothetical protein